MNKEVRPQTSTEEPHHMSSTGVGADFLWPEGLVFRPTLEGDNDHVEAVDTLTGRRFRVKIGHVLDHLCGRTHQQLSAWLKEITLGPDPQTRRERAERVRYWWRRGWHPSAEYYIASRSCAYADLHDDDQKVRKETLATYAAADGLPQREIPKGPRYLLESPALPPAKSLGKLLVERRTVRHYDSRPVPQAVLSGLLWFGLQRIRSLREEERRGVLLAFLESHGAAFDFYVCLYGVDGLHSGVYYYDVERHELIPRNLGNHRAVMCEVLQGMQSPRTAAWTLSLVADFPVYQWRYRHEHALRRIYLDAGFIAQELIILGHAYGLGTLVTPAQKDGLFLNIHGLDPRRFAPIYTLTMGWMGNPDHRTEESHGT